MLVFTLGEKTLCLFWMFQQDFAGVCEVNYLVVVFVYSYNVKTEAVKCRAGRFLNAYITSNLSFLPS